MDGSRGDARGGGAVKTGVRGGGAVETDVVVIGAGISGLSCAKLLHDSGVRVEVLEARDRTGGRIHTIQDCVGGAVDFGAGYVGPTQRRMARLVTDLGLEFADVDESKRTVVNLTNSWYKYKGTIPNVYNPIIAMDLNNAFRKIDVMAKTVPVDAPWNAARAEEWDKCTFREYVQANVWTSFAREMMRVFVETVLTVESHEVSLLYVLWYVRSGQGIRRLTQITDGGQEKTIVGGAQSVTDGIARKLGGHVHLSQPVTRVQQDEDGVKVFTTTGHVYKARYVVSAVPQAILNRISIVPSLPAMKLQLLQRIPMGSIIKVKVIYASAFWKEKGYSGSGSSADGPVSFCLDSCSKDGKVAAIICFVPADRSRDVIHMTQEERKEAVTSQLARLFQCEEFRKPIHYFEKNWMEEEYSGGCYVGVMPPGVLTKYGRYLREPCGRVYFAGTESATHWAGYMEGGVQAGERAAREVLHADGRLTSDQIWQDEPPADNLPEREIPDDPLETILPSVTRFLWYSGALAAALLAYVIGKHCSVTFEWSV